MGSNEEISDLNVKYLEQRNDRRGGSRRVWKVWIICCGFSPCIVENLIIIYFKHDGFLIFSKQQTETSLVAWKLVLVFCVTWQPIKCLNLVVFNDRRQLECKNDLYFPIVGHKLIVRELAEHLGDLMCLS